MTSESAGVIPQPNITRTTTNPIIPSSSQREKYWSKPII